MEILLLYAKNKKEVNRHTTLMKVQRKMIYQEIMKQEDFLLFIIVHDLKKNI